MNDKVNGQITDAVTQTNVKVLGEAPAQALCSYVGWENTLAFRRTLKYIADLT